MSRCANWAPSFERIVQDAEGATILDGSLSLFDPIWNGSVSADGAVIESVHATEPSFRCEGRLWLLAEGGESFSLPFHAAFALTKDRASLSSYEVKVANAVSFGDHFDEMLLKDRDRRYFGREFDRMRERLAGPREWVIVIRKDNLA